MIYDLEALESETRSSKCPNKPFGYEYRMDMREIEATMVSEGMLRGTPTFLFEGASRYQASKVGDLTMSQRQDLGKWLGLIWAGGGSTPSNTFTTEELEYLEGRLNGANDPTGQSILAKVIRLKS